MEWRKVKNLIILVLLLVNGFLLVIVGNRLSEERRYEKSALDQAVQVLDANGIRVTADGLTGAEGLYTASVERSAAREQEMAVAFLGSDVAGQNQGGGLYTYKNGAGSVTFRSGGQFSSRTEGEERWQTSDPEDFVSRLLEQMGVQCEVSDSALAEGSGTVTLYQLWQGKPL